MTAPANPSPAAPEQFAPTPAAAPPRLDELRRDGHPVVSVASRRSLVALLPAAGLLASAIVLWRFNPSQHGFYPRCMLHATTGLDCPGCGILRATHQLLHGHWIDAFTLNPLYVITLPFAALYIGNALLTAWRPSPQPGRDPFAGAQISLARLGNCLGLLNPVTFLAGTMVGFGIVRNLPLSRWFGW